MFKLPPTLPVMMATFPYDRVVAGAFMSIYAVAGLLLSIPVGRWIRTGQVRAVIWFGLVSMLAGNILCLVKPSSESILLCGRLLEGVSYTVMGVVGPVIINGQAPPHRYPLVISLLSLWIPVGQVTAALVNAVLMDWFGWQGVWWSGTVFTVITMIWAMRIRLPEANTPVTVGGRTGPRLSRQEWVALVTVTAVFMLWTGQYYAYMTWLPQYLVERHGWTLSASVLGYLTPVCIIIVVNLITGALLRAGVRIGSLFAFGATLQAITWWLIPLTDAPVWGLVSLGMYGIAAGISPTCLFGMTGLIAGRSGATATGFGFAMSGRNIGVLFGPILIGYLFNQLGSWNGVSPVFAVLTSLAAAGGFLLAYQFRKFGYYQ